MSPGGRRPAGPDKAPDPYRCRCSCGYDIVVYRYIAVCPAADKHESSKTYHYACKQEKLS